MEYYWLLYKVSSQGLTALNTTDFWKLRLYYVHMSQFRQFQAVTTMHIVVNFWYIVTIKFLISCFWFIWCFYRHIRGWSYTMISVFKKKIIFEMHNHQWYFGIQKLIITLFELCCNQSCYLSFHNYNKKENLLIKEKVDFNRIIKVKLYNITLLCMQMIIN